MMSQKFIILHILRFIIYSLGWDEERIEFADVEIGSERHRDRGVGLTMTVSLRAQAELWRALPILTFTLAADRCRLVLG